MQKSLLEFRTLLKICFQNVHLDTFLNFWRIGEFFGEIFMENFLYKFASFYKVFIRAKVPRKKRAIIFMAALGRNVE